MGSSSEWLWGVQGVKRLVSTSFLGTRLLGTPPLNVSAPAICGHHHTLGGPVSHAFHYPRQDLWVHSGGS